MAIDRIKARYVILAVKECSVNDRDVSGSTTCPVFGVRSGGPIIGLGILLILFGLIPLVIGAVSLPIPVIVVFIGFGVFLIWTGLTK